MGGATSDGVDRNDGEGIVLMGEQSGAAHYVGGAQVAATALGVAPRALCRRTFRPAALAAPLGRLCPACAAARCALTPPPRRHRPCRAFLRAHRRPS